MIIRCPGCRFERSIDSSKVPSSAAIATCPKCRHRFRFRALTPEGAPKATPDAHRQAYAGAAPCPASAASGTGTSGAPSPGKPDPRAPGPDADAAPPPRHERADLSRPGDDPLPPGAVIPGHCGAPVRDSGHAASGEHPGQGSPPGDQSRPGSPRDIWDAVASVGDHWRTQTESASRAADRSPAAPENRTDGRETDGAHDDAPFPPHDDAHPERRDASASPWAAPGRSEVPWENLDRLGFFPGLYQTILRVMLAAPGFFSGVRSAGSLKRPIAFYLLIGIFQALTERLWYLMSVRAFGGFIEDPQLRAWMGSVTHDMSLAMVLILSPLTLLLQLTVLAGLYHVMIRLVEPQAADFSTTVRVIAYSAAPTVLSVVPLVGPVVGSLWFVVCTFVGVKYAHRLPWSRTALAVGPLLGLGFALTVQLLRALMSAPPM